VNGGEARARVVVGIRNLARPAEKAASLRGLPQTVSFSSEVPVRLLPCLSCPRLCSFPGVVSNGSVRLGVFDLALNCCLVRTSVVIQFECSY
jgi:hypothetical protein